MKIASLDIGSYSIKIIGAKKSPFGIEPIYLEEVKISRSGILSKEEAIKGALREVFKKRKIREREVVVSLPGHLISTRIISLPFKDKWKIAKVVSFELEGQTPFETDDLIVDYHIISRDPAGSNLLVAAVEKKRLRDLLETLKEIGLEPRVVGVDSLALFNISRYFLNEQGDTAIIDIGAAKTSICLISDGKIKGARTILLGGDLITEAIRDRLSLDPDEAEKVKQGAGDGEKTRKEISDIIRPPLQTIITEIEKTLHVLEEGKIDKITGIYLCGGGAKLSGMKESILQQLGIGSVEILRTFKATGRQGVKKRFRFSSGMEKVDETFIPAVGMLLGRVLGEKGCNINFKKGEFINSKEKNEVKARAVYVGSVILLLLVVALSNIYIKYRLKEQRYQEVKSAVRSVFKETLPDVKNIVDEASQLKGAAEDLKKRAGLLIGSEITILEILNLLSEEIPKEITIDVYELVIDQDKIRIDAETDSFESTDKIKVGLKRAPLFKEVTISDAKVGADQKKVRFRITITMSEKV